jgi:FMN reductase
MTALLGPGGLVVVEGNPRRESRTAGVARRVASALEDETAVPARGELSLWSVLPLLASEDPADIARVDQLVEGVCSADLLVLATPIYKASYTGLLKLFLDRFPRQGLAGTTVVPVVTAGIAHHLLAAEVHLRPLLVELGADVPTRAFVLAETDFLEVDKAIARWWGSVGVQLRRSLRQEALIDSR